MRRRAGQGTRTRGRNDTRWPMFVETGLFIPLTRENVSSFHLLSHDSFFSKQQEIIYSIFQFTPKSSCNSKLKASAVLLNNSTGSVHRESNVPDPAHVLQIPAQSISPLQKISLPGSGGTSTSQAATNNRVGLAGFILSTASRPPATKFGVLAPATHHRPTIRSSDDGLLLFTRVFGSCPRPPMPGSSANRLGTLPERGSFACYDTTCTFHSWSIIYIYIVKNILCSETIWPIHT
jgi:hypothetical protein